MGEGRTACAIVVGPTTHHAAHEIWDSEAMQRDRQSLFFSLGLITAGGAAVAADERKATAVAENEPAEKLERFVVTAPVVPQLAAGNLTSVTLKSVELLMVPGSAGDVNRALQTLPGVQMADEGNALFVRGGDSGETATWINGIRFPGRAQLNTPTGAVAGTISPWQASSVEFAAGGFGASTGDVLSGAVKIKTFGRPAEKSASLNVGIGGAAFAVALPWSERAGATATVSHDDVRLFLDLFDSPLEFIDAPRGESASVAGSWDYRTTGKVKWYTLRQSDELALRTSDERGAAIFRTESETGFHAVSWSDEFGRWKQAVNLGGGRTTRYESMGASSWRTRQRDRQFSTVSSYDGGAFLWRLGAEGRAEKTRFTREFPVDSAGATAASEREETRSAERLFSGWTEVEMVVARRVQVVAGVRGWRSRLAQQTGVDPRLALMWQPVQGVTYSLAGGRYHQVAEAIYFADGFPPWPAMQADQGIFSVEWKPVGRLVRVDFYEKRYRKLVALDRDFMPRGRGVGGARGVDVMVKSPLPAEIKARLTWSVVDADRTDPTTGVRAAAPWAVKHSAVLILDRAVGEWQVSVAGRWASGRAFTPVVAGASEAGGRVYPVFGEPNSERLPGFRRIDLTLARTWELSARVMAVTYIAGFNLAGWKNVSGYAYSDDFSVRRPRPGVFGRSLYFGVNFLFR